MIGFTSAQTSNESDQDKTTEGNALVHGGNAITNYPLHLWTQVYVTHMWKKNPGGLFGGRIKSHHSMVKVSRQSFTGTLSPIFYIDLVHPRGSDRAQVRVFRAGAFTPPGYMESTSYSPNPIVKSGNEVIAAYNHAVDMMAERYDTLTNNCQKFGRIFMTQLGARHSRKLFHL